MKVLVELYREEIAEVEIDTDEYPDETAGWDTLDKKQLNDQASIAAWELVDSTDWQEVDHGHNFVRVLSGESE